MGNTTQVEYDAVGNETTRIDANGKRTEMEYDAYRRLTRTVYPDLTTETKGYDVEGNLTSGTDRLGRTTAFTYDALNRQTQVTYPDGTSSQTEYDAAGRVTATIDEKGNRTEYGYDAAGRRISTTDPLSNVTSFSYDADGNLLSQTDANGNTVTYEYDALDRPTKTIYPDTTFTQDSYDALGDENDRLTEKRYFGNVETYTYDAMGNRTSSHDTTSSGITTYGYDVRNRLTLETQPDGTLLAYDYDTAGNRTSVTTTLPTLPTPTVEATTYGYDSLNRLETVTDNASKVTAYGYDNVGNRASVSYPNGNTTTYVYDTLNRLTQVRTKDSFSVVISQFDYTLGLTGRRDQITDLQGTVTSYGYDVLYRLLREDITGHPVLGTVANDYQYDEVGNRTYPTEQGVSTAYSYDNNNRLITAGGESYTYDDNGNAITVAIDNTLTTNSYDANNRLIQMIKTESGTVMDDVSYQYDLDGIRTAKNDDGVTTNYIVDKNRDYAQVLNEVDTAFMPTVSYVYGDDLIKQRRAANDSYYLYDGLGSTRARTDNTGQVTDTYDYSAYGVEIDSTGITENSYKYTGEQFDLNLDNYYLRARYYDPSAGRFTQQDTWMGYNSDPATLHKYAYGNLDPVNYTDPTGKFSLGGMMSAINIASILVTTAQTTYDIYQVATGEEEFSAKQLGLSILLSRMPGSSFARKVAAKFKAKTGRTLKIPCVRNSFIAGTLIHTKNGLLPIEEIKIGDSVFSYNEETGKNEYQKVVHLIQHENDYQLVNIEVENGESFVSTLDHPFYVDGQWKDAGKLKSSDLLTIIDGSSPIVGFSRLLQKASVYNFSVANTHTYYISEIGALVHNENDCVISVGNMREFFNDLPFGNILKNASSRTSRRFQGQTIFKATKNSGTIRRGDHFYLDGLHKNHIEVFDRNGKFRHVIGLDGNIIANKTSAAAAAGRSINDLL